MTALIPAPPPPKRRRTEDTIPTGLLDGDLWDATWGSSYPQTAQPVGTPQVRMDSAPTLQPQPTHAPTQSPLPTAQQPRQGVESLPSAPPGAAPAPRYGTVPTDQARNQAVPPALKEARRPHVEQPNNYGPSFRSPSALPSGLSECRPHQSGEHPQVPVAPMLAVAGFSSSNHSMWQGEGTTQFERRPTGASSGLLPGPSQNTNTSMALLQQGQHNEPIDPTSDTKQERARLWSAFRTRPVSAGTSKDTSKQAPIT